MRAHTGGGSGVELKYAKHSTLKQGLAGTRWSSASHCFNGSMAIAMTSEDTHVRPSPRPPPVAPPITVPPL